MAIIALTPDQRIAMKANPRYQSLCRVAVENQASFWDAHDGTAFSTAANLERWAKSKFLSAGIILNPNAQDYANWVSHFTIILKNMQVVDDVANPDPDDIGFYDAVLDYMIANGKFDELADLSFNVEIQKLQF
jgi:hypothetical protein